MQVVDQSAPFKFLEPFPWNRGKHPTLSLKLFYMDNAYFSAESAPFYKMCPGYL